MWITSDPLDLRACNRSEKRKQRNATYASHYTSRRSTSHRNSGSKISNGYPYCTHPTVCSSCDFDWCSHSPAQIGHHHAQHANMASHHVWTPGQQSAAELDQPFSTTTSLPAQTAVVVQACDFPEEAMVKGVEWAIWAHTKRSAEGATS